MNTQEMNVIATLPEHVSPQAMAQGAPQALRTGNSYAGEIAQTFDQDDTTKIKLLDRIVKSGRTLTEFEADLKGALEIFKQKDILNGFQAPANAKGREKYGPKQSQFTQRASEARQIFGAMNQKQDLCVGMGYLEALDTARKYLKDQGLNWKGEKADTADEKAEKMARKAREAAMEVAQQDNPMQAGETIAEYMSRIGPIAEEMLETTKTKTRNDAIEKQVKSLIENTPDVAFLDEVCLRILSQSDDQMIEKFIVRLSNILGQAAE